MTSKGGHIGASSYDAALTIMRSDVPDVDAARRLLEEGVADGDPRAFYALATWYLHGRHVRKDTPRAIRLLEHAARSKVRDALFDLAVCYETGRGVTKDKAKAYALYRDAADLSDRQAMHEVGRMLYHGIGVAKDRLAADRWLNLADGADGSASIDHPVL